MPHPNAIRDTYKTQSEYQQKKQWTSKTTIRSTIGAKKESYIRVFVE